MSARLSLALLAAYAFAAFGCTNRCKQGTALVSFVLDGAAATADRLQVEVAVGGASRVSTVELASGRSDGSLEVDFASGYPPAGQTLSVGIVALHGSDVVGTGDVSAPVIRGCTALSVTVEGSAVVADLAAPPDLASSDLATTPCMPATNGQSTQCPAAMPICGSDAACRACALHTECTLGVCKPDGQCAMVSEIAFVDNAAGGCTGSSHAGTQADPYCQIQDAIDAASALPYVHVAGSAAVYKPVLVGGESKPINATVVGPAIFSGSGGASVYGNPNNAITVASSAGQPVTLTVDGLVLHGGFSTPGAGVDCTTTGAAATVTVRNSLIADGGGVGVINDNCTVTVDRASIVHNEGGIKSTQGTTVVTNSFLVRNLTAAVEMDGTAKLTFAFNTVTNNIAGSAGMGGIICPTQGAATVIQSSIVWNNAPSSGTQFLGKCVLQDVVTGTDSFPGAIQLTPTFATSADDYLAANDAANKACCVDKVANPASPNADHDVDLSHRPRGAAWDIGAHEVE